jgi:predicted DNA-binding transcriptional regulator YafY
MAANDELVGWILNFTSQLRLLQPESLREKVKGEAKK